MKQLIKTESDQGAVVEEYFKDNRRHRDDGPAVTVRRADGFLREEYWQDGVPHRDNAPALIQRDPDGLVHEEYYQKGKLHRDAPAVVEHLPNGTPVYEAWWRNGQRDRDQGPALIKYSRDGSQLERQEEWHHGQPGGTLSSFLQKLMGGSSGPGWERS